MNWQPIKTAPKDGQSIQLCDVTDGTQGVAWWSDEDGDWVMGKVWDGDRADLPLCFIDPTHWSPLPELPKAG